MNPIKLQFEVLKNPSKGFQIILAEEKKLKKSMLLFLCILLLYVVAIFGWYIGGAELTAPAIIPIKNYYLAEIFFLIPVFFLALLSSSIVAYLLSKVFNGKGTIEGVISVFVYAATIPTYLTLMADLLQALFFTTGIIPQKQWLQLTSQGIGLLIVTTYLSLYIIGFLVYFTLAIKKAMQINLLQAIIIGLISVVIYSSYLFIFIR